MGHARSASTTATRDRAWLARVVGPGRLAGLRAYGFVEARCGNRRGALATGVSP